MRHFNILWAILALSITFNLQAADDSDVELPRRVVQALDRYDQEVTEAQQAYRDEIESARADAIKDIEYQVEKATKKGDLDLALAIKARLEELQAHMPGGLAELDMLGNEQNHEYARFSIATVDARDLLAFENGAKLFTNRDYTLVDVPEAMKGWRFIPQTRKAPKQYKMRIKNEGYIFIASFKPNLENFENTEKTFSYVGGQNPDRIHIYKLKASPASWTTPDLNDISGAILLIPPAPTTK